ARSAPPASSTRDSSAAGDPVPEPHRGTLAGREHRADELVTENRWTHVPAAGMPLVERYQDRALGVLGGVRAAQSVVGNLDHHLARSASGLRAVLDPQIAEAVQHTRPHHRHRAADDVMCTLTWDGSSSTA